MPKFVVRFKSLEQKQQIVDAATQVIAEYDSAVLIEIEESEIQTLRNSDFGVRQVAIQHNVKVNGYRINTAANSARPRVARSLMGMDDLDTGSSKRQYVIVQFVGPTHADWVEGIEKLGGKIYKSLEQNAHLIGIPENKVNDLSSEQFVDSVSHYMPQLKLASNLASLDIDSQFEPSESISLAVENPRPTARGRLGDAESQLKMPQARQQVAKLNLAVTVFDNEDVDSVVEELHAKNIGVVSISGKSIVLQARDENLSEIASIPEVERVERTSQRVLHNNVAAGLTGATALQNNFGLTGEGQIVAVCDTGLDNGNIGTISQDLSLIHI